MTLTSEDLLKKWARITDSEFNEIMGELNLPDDLLEPSYLEGADIANLIIALTMYDEVPFNELTDWDTRTEFFEEYAEEINDSKSVLSLTCNGVNVYIEFLFTMEDTIGMNLVVRDVSDTATQEEKDELERVINSIKEILDDIDVDSLTSFEIKELVVKGLEFKMSIL